MSFLSFYDSPDINVHVVDIGQKKDWVSGEERSHLTTVVVDCDGRDGARRKEE